MRKTLTLMALISALVLGASHVQAQTGGTGANDATTYSDTGTRDNDRDWGWIGLLGLGGLLGLRRREVPRDTRTTSTAQAR